jgi:hypothetical protein
MVADFWEFDCDSTRAGRPTEGGGVADCPDAAAAAAADALADGGDAKKLMNRDASAPVGVRSSDG